MSADELVRRGRALAESLMLDTFTAYVGTLTKVDRIERETWTAQGTTPGKLPSKVNGQPQNTRTATVGGVERPVIEGGLHLPWAAEPQVGMEYECTALGPRTHPSALGRRFRVIEAPMSSDMTAWRLNVAEVPK